jgi:hypothetical protein
MQTRYESEQGVQVVVLTALEEVEALVRLFEAVAREEGWQPGDGLRASADRSLYFALRSDGTLTGGLQLVSPDAAGRLPCQELWPELQIGERGGVAHVAILALRKEFRGSGGLFWRLTVELWRHCRAARISELFLEVTPRVLPLYRRLGWPLALRGPLRTHWGEDCYLCSLGVREVADALAAKAARSETYRRILARAYREPITCGEAATLGSSG